MPPHPAAFSGGHDPSAPKKKFLRGYRNIRANRKNGTVMIYNQWINIEILKKMLSRMFKKQMTNRAENGADCGEYFILYRIYYTY